MANNLKKLANGHLIKNAAGHLVKDCGNPCDLDREMLVTVTGATGAINWCGELWNLPGDSGVQKSVCPNIDGKSKHYPTTGAYSYVANNRWTKTGLSMQRKYYTHGYYSFGDAGNALTVAGDKDWRYTTHVFPPFGSWSTDVIVFSTIGKITGLAMPTFGDYAFQDAFFGNHTIAGITYTWAKGAGW